MFTIYRNKVTDDYLIVNDITFKESYACNTIKEAILSFPSSPFRYLSIKEWNIRLDRINTIYLPIIAFDVLPTIQEIEENYPEILV